MSDPESTAAGKQLAAARKIGDLVCSECGAEYRGRIYRQAKYRYCSDTCKWKNINARRRAARNAD